MRSILIGLVFLCTGLLASCGGSGSGYGPEERAAYAPIIASPESMAAFYGGATYKSYSRAHGTQIEYLASNGRAYLWYPGNTRVVPGRWKTDQDPAGNVLMCFRYGANTYNPVTRRGGGDWECQSGIAHTLMAGEVRDGDPLGLASGQIPFVLPRGDDIGIEAAMARAGKSQAINPDKATWRPFPI
jgi:hypothetical protein